MEKILLTLLFFVTLGSQAQTRLTHSTNQNVWANNSAACTTSGPGTIHNNSFIRVFDTDEFNVQDSVFFVYIELGVESTSGGNYDLIGRIHELNGSLAFANMTLLAADTAAVYPDSVVYKMTIPIKEGHALPGDTIITEVFAPLNPVIIFFPGSNPYAETDPSYIAAAGCGLLEPTDYETIGFPSRHLVLNLWVNHKPTLNTISSSVFKNNELSFQKSEFDAAVFDHDSDTIGMIRVESLPANGLLELASVAVSIGDTIYGNELDQLTYTPDTDYSGSDNFTVRIRDAYHWANNTTDVDITVFNWQLALNEQVTNQISLLPNPASDHVTVQCAEQITAVRLFNSLGDEIEINWLTYQAISVEGLATGTYFVLIETELGWSVERLIKH